MSGPTQEQIAAWAREADVEMNFTLYPSGPIGSFRIDEFMRLMAAAYSAGQAAEKNISNSTSKMTVEVDGMKVGECHPIALEDLESLQDAIGGLVKRLIEEECEACAKLAESMSWEDATPQDVAMAIRARGKEVKDVP